MDRRCFLKITVRGIGGIALASGAYSFIEAKWCDISYVSVRVPNLPKAFRGTSITLITDVHHGTFVPLSYVEHVVSLANGIGSDLVCLCGDYVVGSYRFIDPCIHALGRLRAPFGVFAVLGNHDHWTDARRTKSALHREGIIELINHGIWIEKGGARVINRLHLGCFLYSFWAVRA